MNLTQFEKNILKLISIENFGGQTIYKIIKNIPEFANQEICLDMIEQFINEKQKNSFLSIHNQLEDILNEIIKDLDIKKINLCPLFHKNYPEALLKIYNPPAMLFYKGNLNYDYFKSISIVGSRKTSSYGSYLSKNYIEEFSKYNMTIISGLALGIDSKIHTEAVGKKLKCIGVVGHGLNFVYPTSNHKLYEKILENNGCIISEYLPNNPVNPMNFPFRNRIIAGLSRSTLIVEANLKSGSLITANYAFESNREVYAIPCDINKINFQGCNHLIKNQIAKLTNSPKDIIKDMGLDLVSSNQDNFIENLNKESQEILEMLSYGNFTSENIALKLNKNIQEVNSFLSELELDEIIMKDNKDNWIRLK